MYSEYVVDRVLGSICGSVPRALGGVPRVLWRRQAAVTPKYTIDSRLTEPDRILYHIGHNGTGSRPRCDAYRTEGHPHLFAHLRAHNIRGCRCSPVNNFPWSTGTGDVPSHASPHHPFYQLRLGQPRFSYFDARLCFIPDRNFPSTSCTPRNNT